VSEQGPSKRLAMLEKLLAAGSTDPFVWYGHAMELRSLGRQEAALERFGAVRERFPDYVPTYLMAAQTAQALGRTEEVGAWLDQGIEVAAKAGDAHALSELQAFRDS
jgi:tetratricopeptide (TPR) repeat protein